ncbi:uncharacterized protein A4U43_C07F7670 [Asparagus officinalis]|uniref:Uncharacterized protein n=1 Tax=Asparagus officinalis TaxID=4686 RepID=A0A5P1EA61_ASPOF|nr:uncharacterized protein A4U43_C07F7670 [Asparagus officinalis]
MGDSLAHSSHENASDAVAQKSREENNSEVKDESSNTIGNPEAAQSSDVEKTIPMAARPKTSQPDTDSSKNSGNLIQAGGKESGDITAEPTPGVLELNDWDQGICELDNGFKNSVELPIPEIQADEDMDIQSAAWVETEHKGGSASHDSSLPDLSVSPELASAAALSNRRAWHSLSQYLQVDNNELEIIEWGKAFYSRRSWVYLLVNYFHEAM